MDIWIVQDGEKTGPFPDYEIRTRIHARTLSADTPAWHAGLDAWRPLDQMELFKRDFSSESPSTATSAEGAGVFIPVPPPLPKFETRAYAGRRFWARWLDLYLFAAVAWLVLWATGQNIEALTSSPTMLFQFAPWFLIEIFLIARFGTTPGKWLMGLRVINADASLLSPVQSARRAFMVLGIGIGFGLTLLSPFCQALSYFTTRRIGKTVWDHFGRHQVVAADLSPFRVAALAVLFMTAIQLQMAVISPYILRQASESFPELREKLEKNPPWHLPPRH